MPPRTRETQITGNGHETTAEGSPGWLANPTDTEDRMPTREELHNIKTWEDAIALATDLHGQVISITDTDMADGFRKATDADKDRMIGVPLLLVKWRFVEGDYENVPGPNGATGESDEFTVLHVIRKEESGADSKWIITDGGTGINRDLHDFTRKTRVTGGVIVKNGLRVSRYHINADTKEPVGKRAMRELLAKGGRVEPAATYYLDTSG